MNKLDAGRDLDDALNILSNRPEGKYGNARPSLLPSWITCMAISLRWVVLSRRLPRDLLFDQAELVLGMSVQLAMREIIRRDYLIVIGLAK